MNFCNPASIYGSRAADGMDRQALIKATRGADVVINALDGSKLEAFIGPLASTPPELAMAEAIRDLPKAKKAA